MKTTHYKLIQTPKEIEFFHYEKPIFYDFDNKRRRANLEVKDDETKKQNRERSLYRSRARLRRLVNANVDEWASITGKRYRPLFLTLTFRENIIDLQSANYEFTKFIQNLNYLIGFKKSIIKYLVVPEFQKRGAVHYHVIIFNLPFVDNIYDKLNRIWGNGFMLLKSLDKINNIGNYISKYMSKGKVDLRLISNKAYFASHGLKQPIESKDETRIKKILETLSPDIKPFEKKYKDEYYGTVVYKNYPLRK